MNLRELQRRTGTVLFPVPAFFLIHQVRRGPVSWLAHFPAVWSIFNHQMLASLEQKEVDAYNNKKGLPNIFNMHIATSLISCSVLEMNNT